jgi:hypothetical protein
MPGNRYTVDNVVTAFTGQEGRLAYDTNTPGSGIYTHAPGAPAFALGGAYFGGSWGTHWLSYDGHPGLDLRTRDLPSVDEHIGHVNVFAAAGGVVDCVFEPAANHTTDLTSCEGGGGSIVINHGNGYRTIYMHLYEAVVTKGQQVARSQRIGIAGERGAAGQPHLHFEVRRGPNNAEAPSVDPYGWSGGCVDPYRKAVNTNLWTDSGTEWPFNQPGNASGWTPNTLPGADGIIHVECFSVHDDDTIDSGAFWLNPSGNDPNIQSPPLVNVAATAFRTVEMRLISGNPSTKGRVYFTTKESPAWTAEKSEPFEVRNDGGWHVVTVPMGANAAWTGEITGIRIDPAEAGVPGDSSDTIGFDYIKLTSGGPSAAITANGQDGSVNVSRSDPLRIEITADGGSTGFANPSELYLGVNGNGATYWLTPLGNFSPTLTRLYRGPLPSFGPAALVNLPTAGVLPNGVYRWFVLIVNGTTPLVDVVTTTIEDAPADLPAISGLNPPSPPALNADQPVGVLGSQFQPGLVVDVFNSAGVRIATLSGTQIQNLTGGSFTMIVNLGAGASTFAIEVVNPDGRRSNRHVFGTTAAAPPSISGLNPASPPVFNGNQSIGVLGSGFQAGLIVEVYNGSSVKIATLSGTQIQNVTNGGFTMIANLGSTPGTFGIEVVNPDGQRSNRRVFSTVAPPPFVSGLSPSSPPVVNGNQNISVLGSAFQAGLVVDVFNSNNVKIATLSGTQVQNVNTGAFTMVANLGATPGTFGIEVVNPDSRRSNRHTFSTANPNPVVSRLSPATPPVVNGNQSIGVIGSSFLPGLIVEVFNSSNVRIGTLSGTQIQNVNSGSFTMIANLGATPGTFGIDVINPDGKRSLRHTFSTVNPAPVVSGLSPSSPPVVNGNQSIGVFGNNFLPGLMVDIFNSSGVKIGTLSGTQVQSVSSGGFTMIANLGPMPATFGMEVLNPDGKRSGRWTFSTR